MNMAAQPTLLNLNNGALAKDVLDADGVSKPLYSVLPDFVVRKEIDEGRLRVSAVTFERIEGGARGDLGGRVTLRGCGHL